jgi:muramoyltetrapeptide carboxypeptidase
MDPMPPKKVRIGVMAPGSRIEPALAERVKEIAHRRYPDGAVELQFHPQCFLSAGHFAGADAVRAEAFVEIANDAAVDALWFARGGYGACRIAEEVIPPLAKAARRKVYLGYSDTGNLLAGLYKAGFSGLAHGPMPADALRAGGEAAVERGLAYLVERAPEALEASLSAETATAAFNLVTLSQILGTPLQPDLSDHVLLLEEVGEYMYRIDRFLFHITSNPGVRRVAGIRLGRCSNIPENDPDFGMTAEEVTRHWCGKSGIPYLGPADIGHDIDNKVVPFGRPITA